MAIISKNTKIYCNAEAPITTIDGGETKNNIPFGQEGRNSQNYYGETEGGPNQEDLLWQPSSAFGITTGRTAIKDGALYYEFSMPSTYRKRNTSWVSYVVPISFLFGGIDSAGTYENITRSAWASSEFITDSETFALSKFDKRTDGASLKDVKNGNINGKPPVTGAGGKDNPNPEKKNNTLIFGGIGLTILVFCIWFFGFRKS